MGRFWKEQPIFVAAVVLVLVVGGAYLGLFRRQPKPPEFLVVPTPAPFLTPLAELPELYHGMKWGAPKSGRFTFITRTGKVVQLEGYRTESEIVKAYPSDFLDYYRSELAARGWKMTDVVDGDGEWSFYEKNGSYIAFGFDTVSIEPLEYQLFVQHK